RIIETANDAFIEMDAAGHIANWNRQAEKIFGWNREEVLGRILAETIVPPDFREAHIHGLERFLATGEGPVFNRRIELKALHRDGHILPIELTVWPVNADGVWSFNAFIHDITAR